MEKVNLSVVNESINYLMDKYAPKGNFIAFLMLASVFVDIYDFLVISFVLPFIKETFNPSPSLLALSAAAIQAGALIGAITGGWITDRLGRRSSFLLTISMMTFFGLVQSFSPNIFTLILLRFFLGYPLGMDFAVGFAYISEYLKRGRREVVGSRWQVFAGGSQVAGVLVVLIMILLGVNHDLIWRIGLGLGGAFSLIIAILRTRVPETIIWLIVNGKFREAKDLAKSVYNDELKMLPYIDVNMEKPKFMDFMKFMSRDKVRFRGLLSSWIQNFALSSEFYTFTFYIPIILQLLNVTNIVNVELVTLGIYIVAVISAYVGSTFLIPRKGLRPTTIYGFSLTFSSLLLAALGIYLNQLLIVALAAAIMQWGHYWDSLAEPVVASIVAPTKYRGLSSGSAYAFVKLAAVISIYGFPIVTSYVGLLGATLMSSGFALLGLISSVFIMPEVFNLVFSED